VNAFCLDSSIINSTLLRAIAWQVYGGLLSLAAAVAVLAEIGWWIFFFAGRTLLTPSWTIGIHAGVALVLLGVWHYFRARDTRERALADAGEAADLDGAGPTFHLGPFAVKVEIAFLATVAVLGFLTGGLLRAAAFVVSATAAVLLHELGHAFAARRYGHVATIHLHAFGGTTLHLGRPLSRAEETAVTLAGPAVPLVLGGFVYQAVDRPSGIVLDFVMVTAGWSILNLLPILPLDGGRLFLRGTRVHAISLAAAAVCAAIAAAVRQWGLVATFGFLASYNFVETPLGRRVTAWSERVEARWRKA